jgi:hypothetical protein
VTLYVLYASGEVSPIDIVRLLGIWPISLWDVARTLLLLSILFAGPLFESGIVDGGLRNWIRGKELYETLCSWVGYRNYVVVGWPSGLITTQITDQHRVLFLKNSFGARLSYLSGSWRNSLANRLFF